jgi:NAD(P)-dependent dehydrogenase (short-subunit alcohol dehydrogenase family)
MTAFADHPGSGHLRDQVIIVTGGGSGIGRAAALLAAERGARIGILDRDAEASGAAAHEALGRGAAAAAGLGCDVTVESQVTETLEAIEGALGPPTGLFTAAGIDIGGFAHELELDTWQHVLATNLTGTFLSCRVAIRAMLASGQGGSVVCCSSPAAFVGFAAGAATAYSASKGGISALVRSLAVDYARYGIRVNALVPGPTETPLMWANVSETDRPSTLAAIRAEVPLGRLADPYEPARAALWLLSPESSYVTGSHLVCDGGVLAKASISV